ncbi:MAG: serine/threonine protein kinase [Planctomycetes bacterium]|nr:serine/threonine protein kinase [Planctomycetota bacterium]MCB9934161.1 serine/threonine protein kinase [Planctomycetota bacterium]
MPVLSPDEILRYLSAKGFLSSAEVELVNSRWSVDKHGPLLQYLGREKLLPEEVVEDLITLIGSSQLEGLEPQLPGLVLLNMVGRGGRGSVYRAWQPSLRRVVAVKILSKALSNNREYIQRFLREARVASKVQHRNIVRAFDINKKGPNVYMVMEYVSGVSLGQVLRIRPKLELPHAIEIARLIADAVAYIGKVGLVHRDIKPDNIMIDRKGRVKLCDLGLARPAGSTNLTSPMVAQGTPAYMAPEAAVSPEIDTQADVYSLGVTMYRALLGKLPFENSDPVEVLRMHVEVEPRGLDGGELPGALQDLVRKMLAKRPADRPAAKDLPRELAALQKTIPGLEKHALWELVPGGEPTAWNGSDDSGLSLEPTGEVEREPEAGQAPAKFKPWEDPALAPRPAARGRGMTGMGVGTLGFALFVCILYILYSALSGPGELPQDPRVPELEAEVKKLESELGTVELERKRMAALMQDAAARLKQENAEDLTRKELDPRREGTGDVIEEIARMRESARTNSLPGAGE